MNSVGRRAGLLLLCVASACATRAGDDAASSAASVSSDADAEVDPASADELRANGFTEDEIHAVGRSVAISKLLAVESFVSENDLCEHIAFDPHNTTDASVPMGKTNWTRKLVYAKLAQFRRVDFPQIYARWAADHEDPSVPAEYRRELAKLRNPDSVTPVVQERAQPTIDDGFRALGIVT